MLSLHNFLALCLPILVFFTTAAPTEPDIAVGIAVPLCVDVNFNVTASGYNLGLSDFPLDTLLDTLLESVFANPASLNFSYPVSGEFNIKGRYCVPLIETPLPLIVPRYGAHKDTLQFLVHGVTYTRNYWSGMGRPGFGYQGDHYSWEAYALSQGYSTLVIDRLGNGLSDHPDPIQVVQNSYQVEVVHQMINQIRSTNSPLGRQYNSIIYAGHSFGSIIGDSLVARYPTDVNALILTGFSNQYNLALAVNPIDTLMKPADTVEHAKYDSLPPGYLEFFSQAPFTFFFYHNGSYDPNLFNIDYDTRGTVTIGELITALFGLSQAPEYTGPLLIATGQYDSIFCNTVSTNSADSNCGNSTFGPVVNTRSNFPNANPFEIYIVPNAGHCWHNHYIAPEGFKYVHDWLAQIGY